MRRLIWVYTVCSGLSVRILTVNQKDEERWTSLVNYKFISVQIFSSERWENSDKFLNGIGIKAVKVALGIK